MHKIVFVRERKMIYLYCFKITNYCNSNSRDTYVPTSDEDNLKLTRCFQEERWILSMNQSELAEPKGGSYWDVVKLRDKRLRIIEIAR